MNNNKNIPYEFNGFNITYDSSEFKKREGENYYREHQGNFVIPDPRPDLPNNPKAKKRTRNRKYYFPWFKKLKND